MRRRALVVGAGVAGLSCAALLARRGWQVDVRQLAACAVPVVVLNEAACDVLRAIWPGRDDVLAGGHALDRRTVCWGPHAPVATVAQPSVVIDGELLLARLATRLATEGPGRIRVTSDSGPPDPEFLHDALHKQIWVVDASGRSARAATLLGAGQRPGGGRRWALGMDVKLAPGSDWGACAVETVADGWLFLAPLGGGRAVLQGMVPEAPDEPVALLATLAARSRVIGPRLADRSATASVFEAAPSILEPLCDPGWLAVGDAAVALDPLSGDGTGQAVRGAILAAGVLDGISRGLPLADGLRHYAVRLQHTYTAHLQACLAYYTSGGFSAAWTAEIEDLAQTFMRETDRAARTGPLAYSLAGLDLVPRTGEAHRAARRPDLRPTEHRRDDGRRQPPPGEPAHPRASPLIMAPYRR